MLKIVSLVVFMLSVVIVLADSHSVYVQILNSDMEAPATGDLTFQAWRADEADDILTETTWACFYPAFVNYICIECDQFISWNIGDIIYLEVEEVSSGEVGAGIYFLNDGWGQFSYIDDGEGIILSLLEPLIFNLPQQLTFDEDTQHDIDVSPYLMGSYDDLTYSGNENIDVLIDSTTVTFIPPVDWFGSETIVFGISNDDLEVFDEVEIIVNPVNDPLELMSYIPDVTELEVNQYEPNNFEVTVIDIDSDINYQWSVNNVLVDDSDDYVFFYTFPEAGGCIIEVIASDEDYQVSVSWLVNVIAVNVPPELISFSPEETQIQIYQNDSINFEIVVVDIDSELSYEWYINDLVVGDNACELVYEFTETGEFTIEVFASDEEFWVNAGWLINVDAINAIESDVITVYNLNCYPNPFNPETTISYRLSEYGIVKVEIYNSKGQYAETLANEYKSAGNHTVIWSAYKYPSGIYFYKLKTSNYTETRKMILLK